MAIIDLGNLQKIETNPKDNDFITLMKNISGNPSDEIDSADDPDSIYGDFIAKYTDFDGKYNEIIPVAQETLDAVEIIENLSAAGEEIPYYESASAELVGSEIRLSIPKGIPGEYGLNGVSPTYLLEYNEETGDLIQVFDGWVEENTGTVNSAEEA